MLPLPFESNSLGQLSLIVENFDTMRHDLY
jgi:hypothetical protein